MQVREDDPHLPITSLVAIENSHNKEDDYSKSFIAVF